MIPYGKQEITQEDIDAVVSALRSDFITQGPKVPEFEQVIADEVQARYAIAVNSATSALHLACRALELGCGDILWTTPITFVASANCALYCGAKVDFVDIDPQTYNLSPEKLEEKLILAKKQGTLPKVVVAVHFGGLPCDMEKIYHLGQRYGFHIIEDASHAIGGRYQNEPIGHCRYSDITIFSFHPVKIITTAEGGMALTNHKDLAKKMALLRGHGITRDSAQMTHIEDGPWYYQQIDLGYNYRMTELQAALGISQAKRIKTYVQKRHQLAQQYQQLLAQLPIQKPIVENESCYSGLHLFVVRLKTDKIKPSRKEVFERLRQWGIGVNVHYIPVHTQPYYQRMGFKIGDFPEAEQYYAEALSLPMFPKLTNDQQQQVVSALAKAIL